MQLIQDFSMPAKKISTTKEETSMTNRRDFLQTTIGAAIMGSTAFQQAWAQSSLPIEQVKVLISGLKLDCPRA